MGPVRFLVLIALFFGSNPSHSIDSPFVEDTLKNVTIAMDPDAEWPVVALVSSEGNFHGVLYRSSDEEEQPCAYPTLIVFDPHLKRRVKIGGIDPVSKFMSYQVVLWDFMGRLRVVMDYSEIRYYEQEGRLAQSLQPGPEGSLRLFDSFNRLRIECYLDTYEGGLQCTVYDSNSEERASVCCGSIEDPRIIMLSGISGTDNLRLIDSWHEPHPIDMRLDHYVDGLLGLPKEAQDFANGSRFVFVDRSGSRRFIPEVVWQMAPLFFDEGGETRAVTLKDASGPSLRLLKD